MYVLRCFGVCAGIVLVCCGDSFPRVYVCMYASASVCVRVYECVICLFEKQSILRLSKAFSPCEVISYSTLI